MKLKFKTNDKNILFNHKKSIIKNKSIQNIINFNQENQFMLFNYKSPKILENKNFKRFNSNKKKLFSKSEFDTIFKKKLKKINKKYGENKLKKSTFLLNKNKSKNKNFFMKKKSSKKFNYLSQKFLSPKKNLFNKILKSNINIKLKNEMENLKNFLKKIK